jgi:hypothetical protein
VGAVLLFPWPLLLGAVVEGCCPQGVGEGNPPASRFPFLRLALP